MTRAVGGELLHDCFQRARVEDRVRGTVRPDHKHARRRAVEARATLPQEPQLRRGSACSAKPRARGGAGSAARADPRGRALVRLRDARPAGCRRDPASLHLSVSDRVQPGLQELRRERDERLRDEQQHRSPQLRLLRQPVRSRPQLPRGASARSASAAAGNASLRCSRPLDPTGARACARRAGDSAPAASV